MTFKETLERYHVSPLKYEDGTELDETDYRTFFLVLKKYYLAKNMTEGTKVPEVSDTLVKEVEKKVKTALFTPCAEDVMDKLMNQTGGSVL